MNHLFSSMHSLKERLMTLTCLVVFSSSFAQVAEQDLKRIRETYDRLNTVSFQTTYSYYADDKSKQPIETSKGEVIMDGKKSYVRLGDLEVMTNITYVFSVDHERKQMALVQRSLSRSTDPRPTIDTLVKYCKSLRYFPAGAGQGGYEVICPSDRYSKIIFTYNLKSFLLTSLSMVYADDQIYGENDELHSKVRLEILYSDYKIGQKPLPDTFTYDKYLLKSGNLLKVKMPYMAYRFINQGS